MPEHRLLRFSDTPGSSRPSGTATYQLLALPPTLLNSLTSSNPTPFEIRGDSTDSAALVTATQTFALRGVQNSNSLCICSSGHDGWSLGKWFHPSGETVQQDQDDVSDDDDQDNERPRKRVKEDIEIEAVLHETLEAVVGVPRTDKLAQLLNGCEYRGETNETDRPPVKRTSFDDLRSRLPASDEEIRIALTKHRVVDLDDALRPLPPSFLLEILPSLLATLPLPAILAHPVPAAAKSKKSKVAPATAKGKDKLESETEEQDLVDALDSVDCGRLVALAVVGWFACQVEGRPGRWKFDVERLIREVGIVLLADGGYGQQPLEAFVTKWRTLCGGFSSVCDVALLSGIHILRPPPLNTIQYLPTSTLSPDPATRFSELFSLKPRWPEAEFGLFIDDLTAGDKKKRDALVLKFVRKVKDKDQTWWTPRNLWS
ncbi:Dcc1p [Sporobolomyces koalae]|uniref:Dcc1p n=1 Tax=Sporobolomyces koalae TaxID=500713 RepID=UPI003180F2B3